MSKRCDNNLEISGELGSLPHSREHRRRQFFRIFLGWSQKKKNNDNTYKLQGFTHTLNQRFTIKIWRPQARGPCNSQLRVLWRDSDVSARNALI